MDTVLINEVGRTSPQWTVQPWASSHRMYKREKQAEEAKKRKSVISISQWPLLQFLPPASSLVLVHSLLPKVKTYIRVTDAPTYIKKITKTQITHQTVHANSGRLQHSSPTNRQINQTET